MNRSVLQYVYTLMKTLLLCGLLGLTVAGLQAGPYADADKVAAEANARSNAILMTPTVSATSIQAEQLRVLQEQLRLMKENQPVYPLRVVQQPK